MLTIIIGANDHTPDRPIVGLSPAGTGGIGAGCLSPPNCATVAAHSGPGSVRTMRSLAASSFFVEGGETYGRTCDQPVLPWCDHRSAAASAATRCRPSCAVPLLSDGKIRLLAVGQPAAPGQLPRLPVAGPRRPGRRGGGCQQGDALGPKRHVSDRPAGGTSRPRMPACCRSVEPAAVPEHRPLFPRNGRAGARRRHWPGRCLRHRMAAW